MSLPRLIPGLALVCALVCCPSTQAAFTPFALVAGDPTTHLQADYSYDPAMSADGNYVAYTGSIASKAGIYRTDLATGEEEAVALGEDTGAPSISEDGRYVSFTTDDDPVTGQAPMAASQPAGECSSVYVRDMSKGPQEAGAYTLVSAKDQASDSLSYAPAPQGQSCGAATASRVAISADGNQVAFTVLSPSDLTGSCSAMPTVECSTPPGQVAVRDLATQRTTLVSVTLASLGGTPQPVPSGAALAGVTSSAKQNLANNGPSVKLAVAASTAAISADGSSVGWMGIDIPEQVPVSQPAFFDLGGYADSYAEPLWRRIADGGTAPTRRMLAGDDPSASNCPPECMGGIDLHWESLPTETNYVGQGPAFGSYTEVQELGFGPNAGFNDPLERVTPQMSANGMTVALLSTQPAYPASSLNFGNRQSKELSPANAFVVNMTPGLSRAQAITRLTEWASLEFGNAELDGAAISIAISPDGTRVAFATRRTAFPLAPPALTTPSLSQHKYSQLYEANLQGGTLALVSEGYNGEPANESVQSAAFSGNGETLALASAAENLALGSFNHGSDVYITHEVDSPAVAGEQSVTPLPAGPVAASPWSLSATASRLANGALLLQVAVPGAGSLSADANATVPTTVSAASSRHEGGTSRRTKARKVTVIAARRVAHALASSRGVELVQLRLTPTHRYRSLTRARDGLYSTITLTFTSSGHPRLTETLHASFLQGAPAHKPSKSRSKTTRKRGK